MISRLGKSPDALEWPVPPQRVLAAVDGGLTVQGCRSIFALMKGEFTAIIEAAPEGGFWATCPEVPGANGQGESIEEAKQSLRDAIIMIFEDRLADAKRGLPEDVLQSVVAIG